MAGSWKGGGAYPQLSGLTAPTPEGTLGSAGAPSQNMAAQGPSRTAESECLGLRTGVGGGLRHTLIKSLWCSP